MFYRTRGGFTSITLLPTRDHVLRANGARSGRNALTCTVTIPERIVYDQGVSTKPKPARESKTGLLNGVTLVPYLRVSTREQLDGYGLDIQDQACRNYARLHGARLLEPCIDEGVTGTDTLDRAGLACALGDIRSGRAGGLLIPSLSRLARRLDIQEAILELVWSSGGRVFTVEDAGAEVQRDDPDDPMRNFARKLFGLVHELDAQTIAKRLRDGRKAKAARGGYAGGAPSYGQRSENRDLAEDEGETEQLVRMRVWQAEGVSIRGIADRLNAEGVPTKRGGQWHPTTVARLLDSQARENDRRTAERLRKMRGEEKKRRRVARTTAYVDLPDVTR